MKKIILKTVFTVLVIGLAAAAWIHVYKFKYADGIMQMETFYKQPRDSIDVMGFGSSHAYINFNTAYLWKEYGIASYTLAGSLQPMWNTYYYMKEALKYQKPAVMVLDVYTATKEDDYTEESCVIKNNYGLKLSEDKIRAVMASVPQELWKPYLFEYPTYHARYEEITQIDFGEYGSKSENWKGTGFLFAVEKQDLPYTAPIADREELTPKNEDYLNKIIALAKERQIPLVFVLSPYAMTEVEAKRMNAVTEIAKKNGIPFLNAQIRMEEIGIDQDKDFADPGHLNTGGSEKYTTYIADFLKKNYKIPDRRGDSACRSYDAFAKEYDSAIADNKLKQCKDAAAYLTSVTAEKRYDTIIAVNGNPGKKLQELLFSYLPGTDQPAPVWVLEHGKITASSLDGLAFDDCVRTKKSILYVNKKAVSSAAVFFNKENVGKVTDGVNIVVCDTCTDNLTEAVGIKNDLTFVRK